MRVQAKRLIESNRMNFLDALVFGSKQVIRLVFVNSVLTREEKFEEITRIVSLVFRFDNGTFTEEDAHEAFILLGAVPVTHPSYIVTPNSR